MWPHVALRQFVQTGLSKHQLFNKQCATLVMQRCRMGSEKGDTEWVKLNPTVKGEPYTLTEEQVVKITGGDEEKRLKLKELLLKLFIKYEQGNDLPKEVSLGSIERMLPYGSNQLARAMKALVKQCNNKEEKEVSLQREKENLKSQSITAERLGLQMELPWLDYRPACNSLFTLINKSTVSSTYNINAQWGYHFGQKFIFDCSFESCMLEKQIGLAARHILSSFYHGRQARRPFSMHLCNLDFNGPLFQCLKKHHPDILDFPIGFHAGSYLNIFERKRLVYISSRATEELKYDPEDIYILPAVVERPATAPRSDLKAKREKIRFASLPIRTIVKWTHTPPSVKQYHDILLHVKDHGSWAEAVETHLPQSHEHMVTTKKKAEYNRRRRRPALEDD